MALELSIITGLIVFYILANRAKNKRIKELDDENNTMAKNNIVMSMIIRQANIKNIAPKDLED